MSGKALHLVLKSSIFPPFPAHLSFAMFGMGCFWGAERAFWSLDGVHSTQVGYSGGSTANPDYHSVCTGSTGHVEVVRIVYDSQKISFKQLLKVFWEKHNPTQGNRQGNDYGTQYRSAIYWYDEEQKELAEKSCEEYNTLLKSKSFRPITTEIAKAPEFFYAEPEHQQYLARHPNGYCSMRGTGVTCSL